MSFFSKREGSPVKIITLTYNGLEYTVQFIKSLYQNTKISFDLIIVDNGSTDLTREYLKTVAKREGNVHLIFNNKNRGFAGGNNDALELIKNKNWKYVVLVNNDVILPPGWLRSLIQVVESDSSIGLVGPVSNFSGGFQRVDVPLKNASVGIVSEYAKQWRKDNANKTVRVGRLMGWCLLITRPCFEIVGLLPEELIMFEDNWYSLAAIHAGFKLMVDLSTFIWHFGSMSFRENQIDQVRVFRENEIKFREVWAKYERTLPNVREREEMLK